MRGNCRYSRACSGSFGTTAPTPRVVGQQWRACCWRTIARHPAGVAQLAAHPTCNRKVPGSSPGVGSNQTSLLSSQNAACRGAERSHRGWPAPDAVVHGLLHRRSRRRRCLVSRRRDHAAMWARAEARTWMLGSRPVPKGSASPNADALGVVGADRDPRSLPTSAQSCSRDCERLTLAPTVGRSPQRQPSRSSAPRVRCARRQGVVAPRGLAGRTPPTVPVLLPPRTSRPAQRFLRAGPHSRCRCIGV